MEEKKPERAVAFELKMEADSEDDLVKGLEDLARSISIDGLSISSVSGGHSWSHVYKSRKNSITHDEYFERINILLGKNNLPPTRNEG